MGMYRLCTVEGCEEKVDYACSDNFCLVHAFAEFQKNEFRGLADEVNKIKEKNCGHGNCSKDVIEALADHCALLTKRIEELEEKVADIQDEMNDDEDFVIPKMCANCNKTGHWSESCPTKNNEECEQECDHVGIVNHMNKWRRKYKKAFKDSETFWKYFFKELREQIEGDYEVEDNDEDHTFNHGVCNVLDCTCDCKDCK